jgi:hypothetical protein
MLLQGKTFHILINYRLIGDGEKSTTERQLVLESFQVSLLLAHFTNFKVLRAFGIPQIKFVFH